MGSQLINLSVKFSFLGLRSLLSWHQITALMHCVESSIFVLFPDSPLFKDPMPVRCLFNSSEVVEKCMNHIALYYNKFINFAISSK
jgi:hypothetical protein